MPLKLQIIFDSSNCKKKGTSATYQQYFNYISHTAQLHFSCSRRWQHSCKTRQSLHRSVLKKLSLHRSVLQTGESRQWWKLRHWHKQPLCSGDEPGIKKKARKSQKHLLRKQSGNIFIHKSITTGCCIRPMKKTHLATKLVPAVFIQSAACSSLQTVIYHPADARLGQ